jgi:hypothetical protein
MSGLASVANPLDPDARAIQVYYVTSTGNLAMEFQATDTATKVKEYKYHAEQDDYAGYVIRPSHLATGYFQGAQVVIGFTAPKKAKADDNDTSNNISMLSPVYHILVKNIQLENTRLTFVSNQTIASLWYLR